MIIKSCYITNVSSTQRRLYVRHFAQVNCDRMRCCCISFESYICELKTGERDCARGDFQHSDMTILYLLSVHFIMNYIQLNRVDISMRIQVRKNINFLSVQWRSQRIIIMKLNITLMIRAISIHRNGYLMNKFFENGKK